MWEAFRSCWRILLSTFLYFFPTQLILMLLPPLMYHLYGKDTSEGALYFGLVNGVNLFCQFLSLPGLGVLADSRGRKLAMILGEFGLCVWALTAAATRSKQMVFLVFIGAIVEGFTSSFYTGAQSMLADISLERSRDSYYTAYFVVGHVPALILASFAGGEMVKKGFPLYIPMIVGAIILLLNMTWTQMGFKETLDRDKPVGRKSINTFILLYKLFQARYINGFVVIKFLVVFALASIKAMSFFYVKYRYHLSIYEYTLIVGVSSIFMLFVLLIVPACSRWMGERRVLQFSLLLGAIGFFICGLAWNVYIFCVGLFFSTFLGMANPTHLSIFSKNVTDRVQAEAQSGMMGFSTLGKMIGSFCMTFLFVFSISDSAPVKMPGIIFFLSAFVLLISVFMTIVLFRRYPTEEKRMDRVDSNGKLWDDIEITNVNVHGDEVSALIDSNEPPHASETSGLIPR